MKMNSSTIRTARLSNRVLLPFALSAAVAALASCGSSGGSTPPGVPSVPNPTGKVPVPPSPGGGGSPGFSGGDDGKLKTITQWHSDVAPELVPVCSKGQLLARGLCWDEVSFKTSGVTLKRAGEEWVLFESGKVVSDFITGEYVLKADNSSNGFGSYLFKSKGVDALIGYLRGIEAPNGLKAPRGIGPWHYAFLPEELSTTPVDPARTPKGSRITEATFLLSLGVDLAIPNDDSAWLNLLWDYNGTAEICGKEYRLPVLQRNIEEACGLPPQGEVTGLSTPFTLADGTKGSLHFDFGLGSPPNPSDNNVGEISYSFDFTPPTPDPDEAVSRGAEASRSVAGRSVQ